jgi:hypothetical protein
MIAGVGGGATTPIVDPSLAASGLSGPRSHTPPAATDVHCDASSHSQVHPLKLYVVGAFLQFSCCDGPRDGFGIFKQVALAPADAVQRQQISAAHTEAGNRRKSIANAKSTRRIALERSKAAFIGFDASYDYFVIDREIATAIAGEDAGRIGRIFFPAI